VLSSSLIHNKKLTMTTFSDEIPQNCPLPTSKPCSDVVYHACKNSPPLSDDFLTYKEMGLATNAKGDAACKRFGISVFPTKEACRHLIDLFPEHGPYIATATLETSHGVIALTPSRPHPLHHTWWPFEGIARESAFVVEETS
jgi:hypothetical protein